MTNTASEPLDVLLRKLGAAKANGDPKKYVCVISVAEAHLMHREHIALTEQLAKMRWEGRNMLARIDRRVASRDWVLSGDDSKALYHFRAAVASGAKP